MFWFDFAWEIQHILNQFWWQINFLLLVIIVVLGYLSYKNPTYAVGLVIILLPTYLFRSSVGFLPFTFLELCVWVLFVGFFISQALAKKLRSGDSQYPYKNLVLLIILASTISLAVTPSPVAAAGLWKAYFV